MKSSPQEPVEEQAARPGPSRAYQFGDLTIDCGRRLVLRGREPLPINGLSFDLLLALVECAPNLATPDELMKRVWPGLVVNPETVSQRVKLLRHALGDDARAPRYITAVRGRGYRAKASVTAGAPPVKARRFTWPVLVIALALIALVAGWAVFYSAQWLGQSSRKQSPAALDLYLRARELHQSFRLDRMDKAIRYYELALELDPRLAPAYVGLADALMLRRWVAEVAPSDAARGRVTSLARTALAIDPHLGDAHAILGRELAASLDLKGAARELDFAERTSPDGEYVLRYQAQFNGCCALPLKAIDYAQKGAELDRLNPWAETNVAIAFWQAQRYNDALRQIDLVLKIDPQFWVAHKLRTVVLDDLGRYKDALAGARATVELHDSRDTRAELAIAYARVGDTERARQIYSELSSAAPGKYWPPTQAAMVLLALNDRAGALAALERAYRERDGLLIEAIHSKRLAPLAGEPSFRRLVKLLGQERPAAAHQSQ